MDQDFHYYATYAAARLGGMNKDQARTVAYCCQYVGVMKPGSDFALPWSYHNQEFRPCVTLADWWGETVPPAESELRKYWIPFHYLPGNSKTIRGTRQSTKRYHPSNEPIHYNPLRDIAWHNNGRLSPLFHKPHSPQKVESLHHFPLRCVKNSDLAIQMMNDTITKRYRDYDVNKMALQLFGCRLHVYQDTWAHHGFTGTNNNQINGIDQEQTVNEIDEQGVVKAVTTEERGKNSPWLPSHSVSFGHSQLGSLPDEPFRNFAYKPNHETGAERVAHVRNNRADFFEAFQWTVYAVRCFLNNTKMALPAEKPDLTFKGSELIEEILATPGDDLMRSHAWLNGIPKIISPENGVEDALLPYETYDLRYIPQLILEEAMILSGGGRARSIHSLEAFQTTDFYKFVKATEYHANWFDQWLISSGLNRYLQSAQEVGDPLIWTMDQRNVS